MFSKCCKPKSRLEPCRHCGMAARQNGRSDKSWQLLSNNRSIQTVMNKAEVKQDIAMAKSVTLKLLTYCRENDWAGYDPYDALNSRIFSALPFLDFDLPRLVLTQALKRSPVNIRRFLLVPKKQNPKAMGLFLAAMVKLS